MTDTGEKKSRVLVADDAPENIDILKEALGDEFDVTVVSDGGQVLNAAETIMPDVILLETIMPGMDGYDICRRLKQSETTRGIPVIFITGLDETASEAQGFKAGCVDYLTRPISPSLALARIKTHSALRQARLELQEWNTNLKRKVIKITGTIREKNQEIKEMQEAASTTLISAFSGLLEMIDPCHFTHASNVCKLVSEAAKPMSLNFLTIRDISLAALLHDIGKLGMGKQLSNRLPYEQTDGELKEYHRHPWHSQLIFDQIESLKHVALMIRHHHEAFDGSGFPDGLKGDEIPLGAQLIGIANFIDHAVQSASEGQAEYAIYKLSLCDGTLFNPKLTACFHSAIRTVYSRDQLRVDALIEGEIPPPELVIGMFVTRDVICSDGMVLVKKGTKLDAANIASIQKHAPERDVCVDLSNWE